jgi:hypothetical protein
MTDYLRPTLANFHIALSVLAILSGFISLIWHKEISPRSAWGRIYILATFIVCVTAFFVYRQGGFGIPDGLAIATLLMLRIGTAAGEGRLGSASPYIEAIAFSATYFVHMIPGIIEISTRLPLGAPLVADRGDPILLQAIGVAFGLFVLGVFIQFIRLLRKSKPRSASKKAAAEPSPSLPSPSAST